jgi:hypothetical protein
VDTSIHATVEAQAIVSDAGVTPFWMRSLQYGSVPMENPGLILRAWNGKGYNIKKKYDWKYEVEATGWTGKRNDIWLTQAYISGRRGKWELWAGRRKEVYGLGDTTMTGGFYIWSGNAVPMPKIQLGTRDYLNFAKGWLGVHMTYSHGWFDNQGTTINGFLHQKTLYGRIGKPTNKINLFGGLNHNVSWGGEAKIKRGNEYDFYPSSLYAYYYVVTVSKNRSLVPVDPFTSGDDSNNQYGNHLGSIDIAIKIHQLWGDIFIYKQTAYETGRIFRLITADDGNNGLSINFKNKKIINKILIEYLYTANQGQYTSKIAKFFNLKDPHLFERESYFNNIRGSWIYQEKAIGTPLIIQDRETVQGSGSYFTNNSVKSIYISIMGNLPYSIDTKYRLTFNTSKNSFHSGFREPETPSSLFKPQTSFVFMLNKKINNFNYSGLIAGDFGQILKKSFGLSISIKYEI